MKILSVEALKQLIARHGFNNYMTDLIEALKEDYGRWQKFTKMPRPAMHVPGGVLELMPICDETYYSFKYVNCHPKNPQSGKLTVIATGQLSRVDTGYPLMFSEMTILTAFRTAAVSALATDLMARENAKTLAIIGTGAQSEFQIRALQLVRDITEVRFFDVDSAAMDKFEKNLASSSAKLIRCKNAGQAVDGADIITTCTARKKHADVVKNEWVKQGMHINTIGGDSPGKTELEFGILSRSRVVVEYLEQALIEGEIQRWTRDQAKKYVHAELYEIVNGTKQGRENEQEITLFDSIGIALEDYSALRLTYELALKYDLGDECGLIPDLTDPKNLIASLL